jgi:hypothetical protein
MNNVPQELDWVNVRSNCSTVEMFKQLRAACEGDVAEINAKRNNVVSFRLTLNSSGTMFIVSEEGSLTREVKFYLGEEFIKVVRPGMEDVRLVPTLNNEGRCKLSNNQAELEQWQVRRMALEDLFFGPYER